MHPFNAGLVAVVLLAPYVSATHENVAEEIEEPNRAELDDRGQANNLASAPFDEALVILDAYYAGITAHPMPPGRTTGGLAAPVVPSGPGNLYAWYGLWEDLDADATIDLETWEMLTLDERIVAYVEPGSWPHVTQNRAAERAESPDFSLARVGEWYQGGSGLGFVAVTGSLLSTVETRVLSAPDLRFAGDNPLACQNACLADVDRYVTLAPGPVADLYAVVPIADALPPVSFAAVAWAESVLATTPAGAIVAAFDAATVVAPEDERDPANGASQAEIPVGTYQDETRHVFDARIVTAIPAGLAVVSTADRTRGHFLAVEATLGLWRDRNQDGATGPGEVAGACAMTHGRADRLPVRLVPQGAQGHEVAIPFTYATPSAPPGQPTGEWFVGGTILEDSLSCPVEDRDAGWYRSGRVWWFPAGVPELVLEVGSREKPAGNLTHESDGFARYEHFWDRDRRPNGS